MYSQNDEEKTITNYFGNKIGRFLEIGAYDGFAFSNTLKLVEIGWYGICIEPSDLPYKALVKRHGDNEKIKLINCAIGETTGEMRFYDSGGDATSTTEESHKNKFAKGTIFTEIYVPCISAEDLLKEHGRFHDFVSIDTEGTNVKTLKNLINAGLDSSLICVEHDNREEDIKNILLSYQIISRTGENIIAKRIGT